MKISEADYILITQLRSARHLHDLLGGLGGKGNPSIPVDELADAYNLVSKWIERMEKEVESRIEIVE